MSSAHNGPVARVRAPTQASTLRHTAGREDLHAGIRYVTPDDEHHGRGPRPGRVLVKPGGSGRPPLDSVEEIPADLFPSMRRTFGQVYLTWPSLVPPQRT
jgi:hypothetical protein